MYLIVRFTREITDDAEIAVMNFPHLSHNSTLQMLEQFKMELYEHVGLRGYWTTINHEVRANKNQMFVWVGFQWPGNQESFRKTLQETYDIHGMSGMFDIKDVEE